MIFTVRSVLGPGTVLTQAALRALAGAPVPVVTGDGQTMQRRRHQATVVSAENEPGGGAVILTVELAAGDDAHLRLLETISGPPRPMSIAPAGPPPPDVPPVKPSALALWLRAGGGTGGYDPDQFRQFMLDAGYLTLPAGWGQ
jgi:hypothetical protein